MNREVMIVAGEASGDLHGSRLVAALRSLEPDLQFCGVGGPEMKRCGVDLLYDAAKIGVVGLFEVISHLSHILRAQRLLRARLAERRPQLLILIDFPDFNLLLAGKAKALGIPVFYYISPQVWAWRAGRVKTIGRRTDAIGVILPFEEQFYRDRGVDHVHYVGHPLLDTVSVTMTREEFCRHHGIEPTRKLIGILPGSRTKEIRSLLPVFLSAAEDFQGRAPDRPVFLLALAPTVTEAELHHCGLADYQDRLDIRVVAAQRYEMMAACAAVIVASGTATLELLLLDTPMVVAYRVAPMTYRLGRLLVDVDYFSLVNLIAGERLVVELLQDQARPAAIGEELCRLVYDRQRRERQLQGFQTVRRRLGSRGASERAAALALKLMAGNDRAS